MAKPVVVSIPHSLGKAEAVSRLKSGLGRVIQSFGDKLAVIEEKWTAEHLDFRIRALGQTTRGTVDVEHDHVRLEVELPWGLGLLAEKAKALMQRRGKLLLEKK